jgi:hypothetical protein
MIEALSEASGSGFALTSNRTFGHCSVRKIEDTKKM